MYKPRIREEDFAYIISHPNGWVDLYDKSVKILLSQPEWFFLPELENFRLGESQNMLKNKKNGINLRQLYKLPSEVFDSQCPFKSPISIQIELTLKCNLSCKFCFNHAGKARKNELSLNEIKKLLDDIKKMEVMSVFFTGGEATLHPNFIEIINYANQLDLDYFVLTNGSQITNSLLEQIPPTTYFVISFDGLVSHSSSHKGLSTEKLLDVFRLLKSKNFYFSTQYVLHQYNVEDLIYTYYWCIENHIDIAAIDLYPVGRAMKNKDIFPSHEQMSLFKQLAMAKFEYEKFQADWEKKWIKNNIKIVANPYHFTFVTRLEELFQRSFSANFFAYVASDGNVYPDNFHGGDNMFCGGNIRQNSLSDIWQNSFSELRELVKWQNWTSCQTCPISTSYCDYRLPVFSYNLHGKHTICGATNFQKELMLMRSNYRINDSNIFSNDIARSVDNW